MTGSLSAIPSGCLYAIGGFNGQTPLKTVERYSPVTGQWSQVADMNEQRYGVGVGVMDGECVAIHMCVTLSRRKRLVDEAEEG